VVLGVARRVIAIQAAAAAEIDGAGVFQGHDAVGRHRGQHAEEPVQGVTVDQPGAGHQPARVGEMPRAQLVHDDLSRREHRGDIARTTRVVEVDMRDHDGGEVIRADPQPAEGVPHYRGGRRGARLDQARPVTLDQVTCRDSLVAGHPGVDLEHPVSQIGDIRSLSARRRRLTRDLFFHIPIIPDRRGSSWAATSAVARAERAQDEASARFRAERR
jgi:hypothetical protein